MENKDNKSGWKGDPKRHSAVAFGSFTTTMPQYGSFNIIPAWWKAEHKEQFKHKQSKFLSDTVAQKRKQDFRKYHGGTTIYVPTPQGKYKKIEDISRKNTRPKTAAYSPLPFKTKKICKTKDCYEEYMYIGDSPDKPVKELDALKGITTMNELAATLNALENDYKKGVIDKNQFRYRIYLMHMALLAMSDDPKNGEFAKRTNRIKAIKLLENKLRQYYPNAKLKKSSWYYRPARPVNPDADKSTRKYVSEKDIIWVDAKGNKTSKEKAKYFIYKNPKTAGEVAHNNMVIRYTKNEKLIEEIEEYKKQAIKKLKKRAKKKAKSSKTKVISKVFAIEDVNRVQRMEGAIYDACKRLDNIATIEYTIQRVIAKSKDEDDIVGVLRGAYKYAQELPEGEQKSRLIKFIDMTIETHGLDGTEVYNP